MSYRKGSDWSDKNELLCLWAMKRLEEQSFARGLQIKLCRELAPVTGVSVGSLNAKIGNYKSVAGFTGPSNASTATKKFFEKYGHLSSEELHKLIDQQR